MPPPARLRRPVPGRLPAKGSVGAGDFDKHTQKYDSGGGGGSPAADTLALLWFEGRIVPAGRVGGARRWALADTWFGVPLDGIPAQPIALRLAAMRSLRALGIATLQQVTKNFIRRRYHGLANAWRELEADGAIGPIEL